MRDSYIFYRSFYEAVKELPDKERLEIYDAICEYSLNHNETEFEGIPKAVWTLVKPQLEANYKRFTNGAKGGRPKTKTKPKQNQNKTKAKANNNNNVNNNINVNDNVNNNIDNRKVDFANKLATYQDKYSRDMLLDFYEYWTEHNDNGKKMRFEMSKNQPFNVGRRLGTWSKKQKQYEAKPNSKTGAGLDEIGQIFYDHIQKQRG